MTIDHTKNVRDEEEKYLSQRTLQWIDTLTKQNLQQHGLSLSELLRNGRLLKKVADVVQFKQNQKPKDKSVDKKLGVYFPLSTAELEEERKGFQNVLDVDAFLESCKSMGMMDYQLFNQSDVTTENGDLLSACRTIRFLALLCKSKGLEVPEFETAVQKAEVRRRSMTTEGIAAKVERLRSKTMESSSPNNTPSGSFAKNAAEKKQDNDDGSKAEQRKQIIMVGLGAVGGLLLANLFRPKTYVVKKGDTLSSVSGPKKRGKGSSISFHF